VVFLDAKTLFNLSYGLYIIGAKDGERDVGCVVNTVTQSTSKPVTLTVCINKDNYTNTCIKRTKEFSISILSEKAKESTFGIFGFSSSRDRDKFAEVPFGLTPSGLPYIDEGVTGWIQCKVIDIVDNFTHTVFIAEVQEAENLYAEPPMTYAYYHSVIKGKTPPKASSYAEAADEISINLINKNNYKGEMSTMKKFVCLICGYVHEGDAPPDKCPQCGAPSEKFKEQNGDMTWAAEHTVGIAKGAPDDIIEGLRMNFTGECTEVGMYLAMARVAHREGYPEIGLYWEKAAWEEAEHAAKFAELLGEVITDSTKENLAMRVEAENGATAGKLELAKRAKELNLDAIHDTVHEMARDEARHGKAFKGLLERYFK